MISVCVPTYNSLDYLKIFVEGLRRNTKVKHELLVHDNASEDGTEEWFKENKISYTRSTKNLGFCGVNNALRKAKHEYVMVFNTDMYPLTGWDTDILKQVQKFKKEKIDKFTISCRLIEPHGGNPEYVMCNAGHDASSFSREKLIQEFFWWCNTWRKGDTIQYSHPILMSKTLMEEIGYFDERYFPGWAVDHDIAACAYKAGCRNFILLDRCSVYHFISKTFTKLPDHVKNKDGQDVFLAKWGITVEEFRKRMEIATPYKEVSDDVV